MKILLVILASVLSANAASVKLAWTAPLQPAGVVISKFNIYRVTVAGTETISGPAFASTVDGSTLTYTDPNVAPGTYFYKVTAFCAACATNKESALSNETQALVPQAVIIVQPPVQQPAQVILP